MPFASVTTPALPNRQIPASRLQKWIQPGFSSLLFISRAFSGKASTPHG